MDSPTNSIQGCASIQSEEDSIEISISSLFSSFSPSSDSIDSNLESNLMNHNYSLEDLMKDGGSLSTKSKKQFNDVNAEFILLGQVESENGNWVITLVRWVQEVKYFAFVRYLRASEIRSRGVNFKNLRVEIRITSTLEQINFDSGRMIHENPEVLWFTEGIDTVAIHLKRPVLLLESIKFIFGAVEPIPTQFQFSKLPIEIFTKILSVSQLSLADIRNLIESDPTLSALYRPILKFITQKRLKDEFEIYFNSVSNFNKTLLKSGAIVSGSTILYVLKPGDNWVPGDLDILVTKEGEFTLANFLSKEGYVRFLAEKEVAVYNEMAVGEYLRPYTWIKDDKKIDVFRIDQIRLVDFILAYHSSPVMNFYDGKRLVCLYPSYTFDSILLQNKFIYNLSPQRSSILKYIARGYQDNSNNQHAKIKSIQDLPKDSPDELERRYRGEARRKNSNLSHAISEITFGRTIAIEDMIVWENVRDKWFLEIDSL